MNKGWARRLSLIFAAVLVTAGVLASSASAFPKYGLAFSFGAHETGEFPYYEIEGVGTDAAGNVYLPSHNTIQKFNSEGTFLSEFGASAELWRPDDVATDSKGNLWVSDKGNSRLVKFNSAGTFLGSYSGFGEGNGQLYYPGSIAIDSKDNIWVNDYGNSRLEEFNSAGTYLRKITGLSIRLGVAVDSKDDVWVANPSKGRIEEYSPEGAYLGQVGENIFSTYEGVDIDSKGNIWASDAGGCNCVKVFNTKGELLTQFGEVEGSEGSMIHPMDLALDASDKPWVVSFTEELLERWLAKPDATTNAPVEPGLETILSGTVNPNGTSTSYLFEYGTTTAYGTKAPTKFTLVGSGTSEVGVSKKISTTKETTYHYRVVATSAAGTTYGKDETFFTGIPAHNTSLPVVSPSTPTKGVPVTTSNGTWTGSPAPTFNYRWRRCTDVACTGSVLISGQTSSTYTPVTADVGFPIYSVVTGRNSTAVEIVNSNPTAPVKP